MRMPVVSIATCLAVSVSLFAQGQTTSQEPPAPPPTFRTGVDVIAVDVSATDSRGRPVEDLLAPDFVVKIDGTVRRVVSAELVKIDVAGARREAADPFAPLFTTNQKPPNGRLMVLAVDQRNIRPGAVRGLLEAAGRFLDRLSPLDRVAFVAYPPPGPVIDFTNDYPRLKRAMATVVGSQNRYNSRLNIGINEAIEIVERSNDRVFAEVLLRECRALRGMMFDECETAVRIDTERIVSDVREQTEASLQGLRSLLLDLSRIEGPKTLILMSEGLIVDSPSDLNDIIRLAGLGRVTVNVLLMDVPFADASIAVRLVGAGDDRRLEVGGLEDLAAYTRGVRYNVIGTGDNIFERIAGESSAFYLLGVEETTGDRDGSRHRIDVEVKRSGVLLRSRRAFVLSSEVESKRSPEERLVDAIKSPFAVAELPLRATTFVMQDPSSDRVRLMIAAEVGVAGTAPAEFAVGFVIVDGDGTVVGAHSERKRLEPADGRETAPLEYLSAVLVEPGTYTLRLAAVDPQGRRGTVMRSVSAWKMVGEEFAFGDLIVGNLPETAGGSIKPGVEPHVDAGAIGAFLELYSTTASSLEGTDVTFEIAVDEDAAPLTTARAQVIPGAQPSWRTAQAAVDASALPPGRYVARVKIARGGKPAGVMIRPFVLGVPRPGAIAVAEPLKLGEIAKFDRAAVLAPALVANLLDTVASRGPAVASALVEARAGRYGPAALEALTAGDQIVASFLRGLDFYSRGQLDQAVTQLNLASGPRREFFPASFFLGAAYAESGRNREAAGILQLAIGSEPRPAAAYAMFADARFRDGSPESVIDVLRPAYDRTPKEDSIAKRLGLAYVALGRFADATPVLDNYLSRNATDQDALFAAILSSYRVHSQAKTTPPEADRARLKRYGAAYRGPNEALTARYLQAMGVQ